jgi:hypothetical protein
MGHRGGHRPCISSEIWTSSQQDHGRIFDRFGCRACLGAPVKASKRSPGETRVLLGKRHELLQPDERFGG